MIGFLRQKVTSPDVEIFIVVSRDAAETQAWLLPGFTGKRDSIPTEDGNESKIKNSENGTIHVNNEVDGEKNSHDHTQDHHNHNHHQDNVNHEKTSGHPKSEDINFERNGTDSIT